MKRVLAAEFLKLRYLRSSWLLLLAAVLLAILNTTSTIASINSMGKQFELPGLDTVEGLRNVYANAPSAYVFAIIVGIMISSGEFRHGTAIATYLAQADRKTVLAAKMVTAATAGFVLQLVSTVAAILAGNLYLSRYEHAALAIGDYAQFVWAGVLAGVVLGIVGVALGTLVRNQTLAIVGSLIWLLIVEGLLIAFVESLGKWMFTGAISAVLDVKFETSYLSIGKDLLPAWGGTALLLGYAMLFAAVGVVTTLRRDID